MKKYIKPEIKSVLFETQNVITTSSGEGVNTPYKLLKTSVNGNKGTDYGRQDVSIFDNN